MAPRALAAWKAAAVTACGISNCPTTTDAGTASTAAMACAAVSLSLAPGTYKSTASDAGGVGVAVAA